MYIMLGLSGILVATDLSPVLQQVAINLEEDVCYQRDTREQNYHFALSGRAFAVIMEHFPHLVQKVQSYRLKHTNIYKCTAI